ncbi:hypothetical protein ACO1O0_008440 [Amphichorda felina]
MRIPFTPAALTAGTAAVAGTKPLVNGTNPAEVLMTNNGHIYVSLYDGASFSTMMNRTVPGNPTWTKFVEPNKLYAVNENGADMTLFHLDLQGSHVSLTPVTSTAGSEGVVHVELSQDGTRMVGAGYGAGAVDIWDTSNEGLKLIKTIESNGELGPVKPNQDQAHPHQAVLDPSGRFFAVNDLGTDEILLLDSQDDAFDVVRKVPVTAGCGPRHGVFYPQGAETPTHYMVSCELSNMVIIYELQYAKADIEFTKVNAISTFAPNATVPEGAAAGEIALSHDNRHFYVSNRLTGATSDTIAHFTIGYAGTQSINYVSETPTGGVSPRMFSLTTDGTEILVGNQKGPEGVVALGLNSDGSIMSKPKASLPVSMFGDNESGPPFIQQIKSLGKM